MISPTMHEIQPERCYCGPASQACLTGKPANREVRTWINRARGRPDNAGNMRLHAVHLLNAIGSLGYGWREVDLTSRTTLRQFAERYARRDEYYLINVTGHYVTLKNDRCADNRVRFGCLVDKHPSRLKKIKQAWLITKSVQMP